MAVDFWAAKRGKLNRTFKRRFFLCHPNNRTITYWTTEEAARMGARHKIPAYKGEIEVEGIEVIEGTKIHILDKKGRAFHLELEEPSCLPKLILLFNRSGPPRSLLFLQGKPSAKDCFLSAENGFLPTDHPGRLPMSHQAWEDLAEMLPTLANDKLWHLYVAKMPTLSASAEVISDQHLMRASSILGLIAAALYNLDREVKHVEILPQIMTPWKEVTARLGRKISHLSFEDYFLHNWSWIKTPAERAAIEIKDTNAEREMSTPLVGTQTERVFCSVMVEIHSVSRGLPLAIALAQDAVARSDDSALETHLVEMSSFAKAITAAFLRINPNSHADTYCDPAMLAQTLVPIGLPTPTGSPGLMAIISSPALIAIDCAFGHVFPKDMQAFITDDLPLLWRQFFVAVQQGPSIREYILYRDDNTLSTLWNVAVQAYAGPHGFLGKHCCRFRTYLEVNTKVGQAATVVGNSSQADEQWQQVCRDLDNSRQQRFERMVLDTHTHVMCKVTSLEEYPSGTAKLTIKPTDGIFVYQPGDSISIVANNNAGAVEAMLGVLLDSESEEMAGGKQPIQLPSLEQPAQPRDWIVDWREYMHTYWQRPRHLCKALPLDKLLTHADLRPLTRELAFKMFNAADDLRNVQRREMIGASTAMGESTVAAIAGMERLEMSLEAGELYMADYEADFMLALQREIVRDEIEHKLERYELWDFLKLLQQLHYPVNTPEFINQLPVLLSPAEPRRYWIASAPTYASGKSEEIQLMVGKVNYETHHSAVTENNVRSESQKSAVLAFQIGDEAPDASVEALLPVKQEDGPWNYGGAATTCASLVYNQSETGPAMQQSGRVRVPLVRPMSSSDSVLLMEFCRVRGQQDLANLEARIRDSLQTSSSSRSSSGIRKRSSSVGSSVSAHLAREKEEVTDSFALNRVKSAKLQSEHNGTSLLFELQELSRFSPDFESASSVPSTISRSGMVSSFLRCVAFTALHCMLSHLLHLD
jgi:hypothetical protein